MAGERILAMCHFGGVFVYDSDESMSYACGEAHAIEITTEMKFSEFKSEISSMFNSNTDPLTIKYFLPKNKTNYITVCNDIDLKRMVDIYADSGTTDVYVLNMNRTMIRREHRCSGTHDHVEDVFVGKVYSQRWISGSDKGGQPADQQG